MSNASEVKDWKDDEQVVRAAVPSAKAMTHEGGKGWKANPVYPSGTCIYFGFSQVTEVFKSAKDSWAAARQHPTVQAFDRQFNPTINGDCPACLRGEGMEETHLLRTNQHPGDDGAPAFKQEMGSAEERVRAVWPDAYTCTEEGESTTFITRGPGRDLSERFESEQEAWEDAADKLANLPAVPEIEGSR